MTKNRNLKFIKYATMIKDEETGFYKWKIGNNILGSWKGPPPRGGAYVRSGILDLYTGAYYMFKPLTNMFQGLRLFNINTGRLIRPSVYTESAWRNGKRPWLIITKW